MKTIALRTERLTLRPLAVKDALTLHAVFEDRETMRFMPSLPHTSLAETERHISAEISTPGAHHWAICRRDSPDAIGIVNYLGGTAIPGMGYILRRDEWGKGITTEACRAALQFGFEKMGLDRVELWIDERNGASRRVASKLGFGLKGRIALRYKHEASQHIMMTYGLWAHDWRKELAPAQPVAFRSVQPVLMVHDVAASAEFYAAKLGFRIDFLYGDPPNHAGLSRSDWTGTGVTLQLSQVSAERELSVSTYLYIMVGSQIDALYETYRANGVDIVHPPETHPWGMREFSIRDLNGHILQFGTHA